MHLVETPDCPDSGKEGFVDGLFDAEYDTTTTAGFRIALRIDPGHFGRVTDLLFEAGSDRLIGFDVDSDAESIARSCDSHHAEAVVPRGARW